MPNGSAEDLTAIMKQVSERSAREWNATHGLPSLEPADLAHNAAFAQVGHELVHAAKPEIAPEDGPYPLGFVLVDGDLAIPGVVAERRHAADPQPLALGGCDLVADALGGDFTLELGK